MVNNKVFVSFYWKKKLALAWLLVSCIFYIFLVMSLSGSLYGDGIDGSEFEFLQWNWAYSEGQHRDETKAWLSNSHLYRFGSCALDLMR